MARKLKNKENETHKLQDMDMARNLKNVENETQTLQDLEYGEKSDQRENRETHMVGPGT